MLNYKKIEEKANSLLQKAPGLAYSIFTDKEVLYENGFGVTSVEEQGVEVTPETMFRIGSVSKTITATLIMKLVENGKLDLDVPIIKYIPELKLSNAEAIDIITLRMLLSHTAGFPDGGDLYGDRSEDALAKYVELDIPKLEFVAPPQVHYSYGNHAINLAGYVAEKVMGKSFAALVKEEVFIPLGMDKSTYDSLIALTYPTALQHEKAEDGAFRVIHSFFENATCYPSSMCISNTRDMAKFGQMYLSNGNGILSQQSVNEIFSVQANRFTLPPSKVGLCWLSETDKGINFKWHSGGVGTYRSFIVLFPEQNLGIFTVASQDVGWQLVEEILEQIGQEEELSWTKMNLDKVKLSYGSYLSAKSGLVEMYEDSNRPFIKINESSYLLRAIQDDHLLAVDEKGDAVASIGLLAYEDFIMVNGAGCKKVEGPFNKLDTLEEFEGKYKQGELEFIFTIEDHKSFLKDEEDKLACTYLFDNKFFCPGYGLLEFEDNKLTIQRGWTFTKM